MGRRTLGLPTWLGEAVAGVLYDLPTSGNGAFVPFAPERLWHALKRHLHARSPDVSRARMTLTPTALVAW